MIKAGHAIIKIIESYGIRHGFCVPGESFLEIMDGAYDSNSFQLIHTRHEGGASFMAEAYAKLTGKPSILMVTRGPGACNASIGIHTSFQDSTPMVVIIGDVAREHLGLEAFQEIDFPAMFTPIAKAAFRVTDSKRIPEFMHRAFKIATQGRPGPVVISIPEDVLREDIPLNSLAQESLSPAVSERSTLLGADASLMDSLAQLLEKAKRPLCILGGSSSFWSNELVTKLSERLNDLSIPFATSFRRQDLMNAKLSNYVGELGTGINPALKDYVQKADLVLAIGTRLGEMPSQGYTLFHEASSDQKIVFVHPDVLGARPAFQIELTIQTPISDFVHVFQNVPVKNKWESWCVEGHSLYEKWALFASNVHLPEGFNLSRMFLTLKDVLPENCVLTNDAGNFSGWGHRFFDYVRPRRQLAPVNGAMGYAVPSAIGAKFVDPKRPVIGFAGDGGFLMTAQELATAKQFGLNPFIIVMNNNMYGTIRMHQEARFPKRVSATSLKNPDFVMLAHSYGANAIRLTSERDFLPMVEKGLRSSFPFVLEIPLLQAQISTSRNLALSME
ncbi:MAG: thiamine pyrophosphate-binding protein [Alphaproteobacteria bacterium]|jgi:acetolactate synthase-1/2/3 large subunit|nr:thiamine pyrophosphate-binding protein [Alphaproteobacteria bacterium]MBP9877775.1 thiamine pyrophosphate-binding protein [Alphaproteobacteria bacterium]